MLEFEWDEDKRVSNLEKHRLDFADVDQLFDGRPSVEQRTVRFGESRTATTVEWSGKLYTLDWTHRGENIRMISFRRAQQREDRAYCQAHG